VNTIVVQAASVVTVIVCPSEIFTLSPATGYDALPHVAGEFQLPEVTDV